MIRFALAVLLCFAASDALATRRVALVVGANEAPEGRQTLRYAHADARSFAQMLIDVGDFSPADVHVLLDPAPEAILRRLDEISWLLSRQGESLLLFYYSGHADHGALFPAGRPLALSDVKKRLDGDKGSVRIGILDACRGGAWTGAKGLQPDAPFDVQIPDALGSEGSVLVASSSGLEDAHEAEVIGGSFFTHHLVAGLRGAADRSGDGKVTVTEAFEFAQRLTVRDSAIHARMPQTPSFELNLRGRRDVALTRIQAGPSHVALRQAEGPLQVIRLDTGLVVVELPPGRQEAVVALPPGDYLIRRRRGDAVLAREISLRAGEQVELGEEELQLIGHAALAAKGAEPLRSPTSVAGGDWELRMAVGRSYDKTPWLFNEDGAAARPSLGMAGSFTVGLTDRLSLSILGLGVGYRFGDPGEAELLAFAGVPFSFSYSSVHGQSGRIMPTTRLAARLYTDSRRSFLVGGGARALHSWTRDGDASDWAWGFEAQAGYLITLADVVTLAFGVAAEQGFTDHLPIAITRPGLVLEMGSPLYLGNRPLPLLQLHLHERLSLDGYVTVGWDLQDDSLHDRYLGGITWTF